MDIQLFKYYNCFKDIENIDVIRIQENYREDVLYTIAIPTYKRAKDLHFTIDSILKQESNIDFNILIVDNNPQREDETELAIKNIEFTCLSYYKNSVNIGMCNNWNRLFQLCHTRYLIMVHDDDYLLPSFMNCINNIISVNPEVSALNVNKYSWNGNSIVFPNKKTGIKLTKFSKYTNYTAFYFNAPTGCLFNVKDVIEIGGFNYISYPSFDYVLVQRLCMKNKLVLKTKNKLMLYRVVQNTSNKLDTQIKWLDIDSQIKKELGLLLKLPSLYVKATLYFTIKLRLRSINKIDPNFTYNGKKGGGYIFLIFYKMWRCIHRIYFNLR